MYTWSSFSFYRRWYPSSSPKPIYLSAHPQHPSCHVFCRNIVESLFARNPPHLSSSVLPYMRHTHTVSCIGRMIVMRKRAYYPSPIPFPILVKPYRRIFHDRRWRRRQRCLMTVMTYGLPWWLLIVVYLLPASHE